MADLKKLIVCLSKDLPASVDRSPDYMYLAYDKLRLYSGCSLIDENFAISSSIPSDPVPGMIYILDTDGSVHRQIDYTDKQIAELKDSSQLDILKKAGTVFYVNANNRYLDSQKRSLTLPFNDGTYELNVSTRNNQVFNNNTILKFNEDHERFEVYGPDDDEFVDYSRALKGGKTSSVELQVDNGRILGRIRISKAIDNMIRISSDGLYAKISDKVDRETYETWKKEIDDFKKYAQDLLDYINAELQAIGKVVTPEEVEAKIKEVLKTKYPEIDTALANYQTVVDSLDSIETELMEYSSSTIIAARDNLQEQVNVNSAWDNLDDSHTTYEHEVNYYKIAEDYWYPTYTTKQIQLIVTAAAMAYFND